MPAASRAKETAFASSNVAPVRFWSFIVLPRKPPTNTQSADRLPTGVGHRLFAERGRHGAKSQLLEDRGDRNDGCGAMTVFDLERHAESFLHEECGVDAVGTDLRDHAVRVGLH